MENTSTSQNGSGQEIGVRKSYHAPQLISLGEIQSIIQNNPGIGADGSTSHTLSSPS
jgi:hypothetical protein